MKPLATGETLELASDRPLEDGSSVATRLLEAGYDIRTVQELLGHKDEQASRLPGWGK